MPNGSLRARCHYCWRLRVVHGRNQEDYAYFHGWFCDECLHWIIRNEEHWRLFRIMQMADNTMAHPLSSLIASDYLGLIIASFTIW